MGGAHHKHHHQHLHRRHLHLRPEQQAGKMEAVMAETGSARSSRLPWQQESPSRQVRLPLLQDGEQRFSFYVYGRNGLLQEATLSLHQVQVCVRVLLHRLLSHIIWFPSRDSGQYSETLHSLITTVSAGHTDD